ncbi:hypothetical protein BH09VER1_BH09VER1_28970 [soil metagenome]
MSQTRPPRFFAIAVALWFASLPVFGQSVTRDEVIKVAQGYVNHEWKASPENVRHGKDAEGVNIQTPDLAGGSGFPVEACWTVGQKNTGVAYKWGGFDTPESFDAGVRSGRAAGDVYTSEKRKLGGADVSSHAVGIDCSGFISRCWKLPRKHSTSMLFAICNKLPSPADLKPGDVMDASEGHVLLFVKWSDETKTRALFYEAAPFSKTLASEHTIADLQASGCQPMRYRSIKD